MTNCPHCSKKIEEDYLDEVMDRLADGNKTVTFPCKKCGKTIEAINNASMYYIKLKEGKTEFIGAK